MVEIINEQEGNTPVLKEQEIVSNVTASVGYQNYSTYNNNQYNQYYPYNSNNNSNYNYYYPTNNTYNYSNQYQQYQYPNSYYAYNQYDSNAFLFSLTNAYNTPIKMLVTNPQYAIYSYPYYGPTFGSGNDLSISNYGSYCYSNLGNAYKLPSFFNISSPQSFLAGSYNFQAIEIEVYAILLDRKKIYFLF